MLNSIEWKIIDFLKENHEASSKTIHDAIGNTVSYATIKRLLLKLTEQNLLTIIGIGKSTKYMIAPGFNLLQSIDIDKYFEKELDERQIRDGFNFTLIEKVLAQTNLFTADELETLNALQNKFQKNKAELSPFEFNKEMERLAIDLSWKSSQIEGNTYSLLETERLLKDKETASGKTKEEAIMLLNHKGAIDFVVEHPDYLVPLTVSKIEDIHAILIKELAIERNIRKRRVGISGTNYRPLDNDFQITEALRSTCNLVNNKENVFEKALLVLLLVSYIQPFSDGNKRTARILSNAVLINYKFCPISFRTVDSVVYKKAMLLFYEQNNVSRFKEIFINQFEFAVNTYF